jgi:hypothetical protein
MFFFEARKVLVLGFLPTVEFLRGVWVDLQEVWVEFLPAILFLELDF